MSDTTIQVEFGGRLIEVPVIDVHKENAFGLGIAARNMRLKLCSLPAAERTEFHDLKEEMVEAVIFRCDAVMGRVMPAPR